jgi:hypothetical protein
VLLLLLVLIVPCLLLRPIVLQFLHLHLHLALCGNCVRCCRAVGIRVSIALLLLVPLALLLLLQLLLLLMHLSLLLRGLVNRLRLREMLLLLRFGILGLKLLLLLHLPLV